MNDEEFCLLEEKTSYATVVTDNWKSTIPSWLRRRPLSQGIVIILMLCTTIAITIFWFLIDTTVETAWNRVPNVNSTLGFGKIYALGLASRESRRDELTLISEVANLTLTYKEAIRGETIDTIGLPFRYKHGAALNDGELGCWRSHMSIWRQMLEDKVETALIVEDDVDFDIRVREQLLRLKPHLARMEGVREADPKYMSRLLPGGWEVLWLGACYERQWEEPKEGQHYTAYGDSTVAPEKVTRTMFLPILHRYVPNWSENKHSPGTRVIHRSVAPRCTVAYALSRRGAARLLYNLSREIRNPVDNEMARFADQMSMYTIIPPFFSQWKISNGHNSDLRDQGHGTTRFDPSVGQSLNIDRRYSVRQRLNVLVNSLDASM